MLDSERTAVFVTAAKITNLTLKDVPQLARISTILFVFVTHRVITLVVVGLIGKAHFMQINLCTTVDIISPYSGVSQCRQVHFIWLDY